MSEWETDELADRVERIEQAHERTLQSKQIRLAFFGVLLLIVIIAYFCGWIE